jgi:hypothetical protein
MYDGLACHILNMNFLNLVMCIRNKKHKAKLRIASRTTFTSSCLGLFKEFGPIKEIVELHVCGVLFEIFST